MNLPTTLALAVLLGTTPALADPPRHASAHGYYKKGKHHQGKSGAVYVNDYGIHSGRCNRDEIGGVIGGVLGHAIGDSIDERDRACMGHALELGRAGVPVLWHHDGREYRFVPGADAGKGCRNASLAVGRGRVQKVVACPSGRGEWSFRPH